MTASELLTLRPTSPLRQPAWRWELARHLRGKPKLAQTHDDPFVADAMALQRQIEQARTEDETAEVFLTGADPADAYLFWTAGTAAEVQGPTAGPGNPAASGPLSAPALAQAELEALILADRPPAKISKVTGLSEAAVTAYEQWFFDVRSRLGRPGWISANVIGSLFDTSPLVLLPNLIRAYGYYTRSVRIVRTLVGGFDQAIARRAGRDPGRFFGADAVTAGGLKAALAVRMMSVTDARSFGRIIELHHEAADLEAKFAGTGGGGSESEDKFKAAFQVLRGKIERGYREVPTDAHVPGVLRLATDTEKETG